MGNTVGSPSDPVTTDSTQEVDEIVIPVYDTSTLSHAGFSRLRDDQLGMYISGYTDGEGSFHISIYKRTSLKIGYEVRPSFSVSQKQGKTEVLELMLKTFKCGSIRNCVTDNVDHYEVRKINDLLLIIIPYFEKYPLLSSRQRNIPIFKEICFLVKEKKHLHKDGLLTILSLVQKMEVSTRRKQSIHETIAQIKRMKV